MMNAQKYWPGDFRPGRSLTKAVLLPGGTNALEGEEGRRGSVHMAGFSFVTNVRRPEVLQRMLPLT
jgi:hypothetical protein